MAARGTHIAAGYAIGAAMAAIPLLVSDANAWLMAGMMVCCARAGCMAPDWLEVARRVGECRISLIPHRTLTHWVPAWVVLATAGVCLGFCGSFWTGLAVLAFAAGGLSHVLLDAFTPMGVPWIHPMRPVRLR